MDSSRCSVPSRTWVSPTTSVYCGKLVRNQRTRPAKSGNRCKVAVPNIVVAHSGSSLTSERTRVDPVVLGEHQGHLQQVQAVHRHPGGAVALLQHPDQRQRRGPVNRPDVGQAKETALEDVVALAVLAVDPPAKFSSTLCNTRAKKSKSREPSFLKTRSAVQACTGGLTSPKAHS